MNAVRAVKPNIQSRIRQAEGRQSRAPILSAVATYQRTHTISFSTPGHKGGPGVDPAFRALVGLDALRADVWLNVANLSDALQDAEDLAADAWGAKSAYFLINGSSSGNLALLQAHIRPGDKVIIARDAHRSMINGLIIAGAIPVFVSPRLHSTLDFNLGIDPADVARALDEHPDARLVVITSPTYCGFASDIEGIARAAHQRDVPLFVDQAWGAHLRFHPALPQCAISAGADAVVISPHKTLGGLSQAAMLLVQHDRVDRARLRASISMTQSTSRNLPMLMSLDATRRHVATQGWALMECTLSLADRARLGLSAIPGITVIDEVLLGVNASRFDRTRLVIDTQGAGLSGFEAERLLRSHFAIAPEMSDGTGVICLVTIGDTRESIDALVQSISSLAMESRTMVRSTRKASPRSTGSVVGAGPQLLSPRDAYFSPSRAVPLPVAVGEVSAEMIVPYPPGIPVLVPGEQISWEKLLYLAETVRGGAHCSGAADPSLLTIRVIDS